MNTLTFHKQFTWSAVYLDGTLVYWGEFVREAVTLLKELGYQCEYGIEIPNHDIPKEFDLDKNRRWRPPEKLSTLQKQITAWKAREKRERIERLKGELARLLDGTIEPPKTEPEE